MILSEQEIAAAQPPRSLVAPPADVPAAAPPTVDEFTPDDLARWAEEPLEDAIARLEAKDMTSEGLSAGEYLELRKLRVQVNEPVEAAARQRVAAELRQRQEQAGLFDLSGVENARARPQPTLENGSLPRRKLVNGDQNYLANIMAGTPYQSRQNKVYFDTINEYVRQMLDGGPFPKGRSNLKIWIDPDKIIREGHHRLIAAQIVSRLTGRPLLSGPNCVIPRSMIRFDRPTTSAVPFPWRRMGVLDAPANCTRLHLAQSAEYRRLRH